MKNSLILAIALLVPTFVMAANYKANLNDAQIAAIAVAANQVDIDAGKAAESKSSNQEVKAFAASHDRRSHRRHQPGNGACYKTEGYTGGKYAEQEP